MTQTAPVPKHRKPWPGVGGLLMACLVTGVCAWKGLDPDVILFRAAGAGCSCAVLIVIVRGWMSRIKMIE